MKNKYTYLLKAFLILLAGNGFAQSTWVQKANFGGSGRAGAVGFSIGTKGYIGMGNTGGSSHAKDLWEYDSTSDSWTQKANYPSSNSAYQVSFTISGIAYVGTGEMSASTTKTDEFHVYDSASNTWSPISDFPEAISDGVGFSIGNKGYVGTGAQSPTTTVESFYKYEPSTDTWTQIANFGGGARAGAFVFTANGKAYVGGGTTGTAFPDDFWELDPTTDTWTQKNDLPMDNLSSAVAFTISSKGYVGTGILNGVPTDQFWEYDPTTDTWAQMADFGGDPRFGAAGFSVGGKGYLGTGSAGPKEIWEFLPFVPTSLTADFTAEDACQDQQVEFLDNSMAAVGNNIVAWYWEFGDGGNSIGQNPTYTYPTSGTYQVKLTVTDNDNNKDSTEKIITIFPLATADFTINYNNSMSVGFTNLSVGSGEYFWWFGDGSFSMDIDPVHTYATAAIYNVCLSAYNIYGCEHQVCKQLDLINPGIEEKTFVEKLELYPNPATNKVVISGQSNMAGALQVKLINIQGREIFSSIYNPLGAFVYELPLNGVSAGLYFIELSNNGKSIRQKLMVQE